MTITRQTILYLTGQSEMGGGEKSLLELVKHLDRDRYEPVVVLPAEGTLAQHLRGCGVRYRTGFTLPGLRRGGILKWPRALHRLRAIVRTEKADIIHGNGTRENIALGIVGRLIGVPSVWHLRNLVAMGMIDIEKPLAFLPRRIIANSRAVAKRLRRKTSAKKKLTVIYNGVDMRLFSGGDSAGVRSELGAGEGSVLVGIVGRIGAGKGHEVFMHAAKRALEDDGGENLRFAIIGDELFTDNGRGGRMKDLVERLGISDSVVCTGYRDDVERVMGALDILVLASENEPFGRVLIEAMAAGKALVATSAGGVREVVEGGVTALLVRPGDVELMANAITRLSRDHELRERMGESGKNRVRKKFSIEEHVSKIERIYDDILENRGKRN